MPFNFDASKLTSGAAGFVSGLTSNFAESFLDDVLGLRSRLYYKDSTQSSFDFGQKSPYYLNNAPRLKFQYFAKINFNTEAKDINGKEFVAQFLNAEEQALLVPLIQEVNMPSMSVATEKINQYNQWRISQTKINFDPVTMVMLDVVDGKSLRFWEMYYEYYFKDAVDTEYTKDFGTYERKLDADGEFNSVTYSESVLSETKNNDYGFNLETVQNQKNLIKSVEIFQVHANRWSKVVLVNPKISKFNHDTLDFSQSELMRLSFTFEYEQALYHNFFTPFTAEDLTGASTYLNNASVLELEDHPTSTSNFQPRQRGLETENQSLNGTAAGLPDNSVLGNLQGSIGDIINAGPGQLGDAVSQSLITGEFESPFNAKDIAKQLTGNLSNASKTIPAKNFGAAVKNSSSSFIDVFR